MAEPRTVVLFVGLLLAGRAAALDDPTAHLDAERDALLDKITRGVEFDASVARFRELLRQRDAVVATSAAAREAERARVEAQRAWQAQYRKTLDHEVGWRCTLSPDPAHPLPSEEARFRPDWGKVLRKQKLRLPPRNALDEGEQVTLYEVAGQAGRLVFRGERFDPFRKAFEAEVGELALVCVGGTGPDRELPAGWGPEAVRSGFAARIARPPLIVDKARYQPIHVTSSAYFWAIKRATWKWEGKHVLSNLEIGRDLGGGRFEVPVGQGLSFVVEVPAGLRNREHVVPGRSVWLILGGHRFDLAQKKLVLVAADVEPTYVFAPGK